MTRADRAYLVSCALLALTMALLCYLAVSDTGCTDTRLEVESMHALRTSSPVERPLDTALDLDAGSLTPWR